jgi:hypothetical protein
MISTVNIVCQIAGLNVGFYFGGQLQKSGGQSKKKLVAKDTR